MRLDRLLNEVDVFDRPADTRKVDISSLTEVVADVTPGALFFCVPGSSVDGHDFAQEAIAKGASAIVVDRDFEADVPVIRVPDVRVAMAPMASVFHDYPSRRLRMVGITGTNGKTTTANIVREILQRHHWNVGLIGTLTGSFTTPPAIALQKMLAGFRDQNANAVVMEVSSSALVQHRVDAIRFDVGVFTNLTQDHLDYHKTMSQYFEAKALLFEPGRLDTAVINVDDTYGLKLIDRVAVPVEPYSLSNAQDLEMGPSGSAFTFNGRRLQTPLLGQFNVYNALAAVITAKSMGVSMDTIAEALHNLTQVPGRMELVRRGQPFTVVVDFAHTPDGLENVLTTARSIAAPNSKVLVAFGCGGDRDKAKRPLMGQVAERLADDVVVTSDNPRSEDPATIVHEVLAGLRDQRRAHVFLDRHTAIAQTIAHASEGDVVVIAGKGHETTQEVRGVKTPFDDRVSATSAVDAWLARSGRQAQ